MILIVDVKSLEWCTYLFLSQDKVGIEEWHSVLEDPTKYDIHTSNQNAFNLPSRLIAKIFLFRWIYRGSAYAYANDPDFSGINNTVDYWQSVIDQYYSKYNGIYKTHLEFIKQVSLTGQITSPFGRVHKFIPKNTYKGIQYNESDITNWPNQGLGADVVSMARAITLPKMRKAGFKSKLITTVHDSIGLDCIESEIESLAGFFSFKIFKDLDKILSQYFNINWNVPIRGEIKVGHNMLDLKEYKV